MSTALKGIGVSSGIAGGTIVLVSPEAAVDQRTIDEAAVEEEIRRFNCAIEQCTESMQTLIRQSAAAVSEAEIMILKAHLLIIADPALSTGTIEKIRAERKCAAWAAAEVLDSYIAMFENLEDEYLQQRAADIAEVRKTLLRALSGRTQNSVLLKDDSVIVAADLGPAETLALDRSRIAAIVTEKGGRTSHTSILARALAIPAVVGVTGLLEASTADAPILVDADSGAVIVNPGVEQQQAYLPRIQAQAREQQQLKELARQPALTLDGKHIHLWANIGDASEAEAALANGAEGIGLFRTEFLYMDRTELPSEQEQEAAYSQVLTAMNGKPVVIRTLDVGADKNLPYMPRKAEENPAMGCRAIRLCLKEKELFTVQLRALLKASVCGNLWIMFPMIATLAELRAAKKVLQDTKAELLAAGIPVSAAVKVGMMVEVPAAAVAADLFAREVDFFSIGSNDLIQYVFAADRQNQAVDYLYQPDGTAFVRLLDKTVKAAHAVNIPVGVCGEMAGDVNYAQLLVGLGLDELSMVGGSLLRMKKAIGSIDATSAQEAVNAMLSIDERREPPEESL